MNYNLKVVNYFYFGRHYLLLAAYNIKPWVLDNASVYWLLPPPLIDSGNSPYDE
jgi:hypothetical protein